MRIGPLCVDGSPHARRVIPPTPPKTTRYAPPNDITTKPQDMHHQTTKRHTDKPTPQLRTFCPAAGISIEELRERIRGLAYLVQELPHGEMGELNAKVGGWGWLGCLFVTFGKGIDGWVVVWGVRDGGGGWCRDVL